MQLLYNSKTKIVFTCRAKTLKTDSKQCAKLENNSKELWRKRGKKQIKLFEKRLNSIRVRCKRKWAYKKIIQASKFNKQINLLSILVFKQIWHGIIWLKGVNIGFYLASLLNLISFEKKNRILRTTDQELTSPLGSSNLAWRNSWLMRTICWDVNDLTAIFGLKSGPISPTKSQ